MTGKAVGFFGNGIGNFVMMMPALQALRDMTGAPVDLVFPDEWRDNRRVPVADIARAWDVVGRIIEHPTEAVPDDYDLWFASRHNVRASTFQTFQSRMRGAPVAIPAWKDALIHEREHYMEIVRGMGYQGPDPAVRFPLAQEPVLDLPRPVIGLCNGSFGADYWLKKRWPHFARLANVARAWWGGSVVGIGGEQELDGVRLDVDLTGKASILESAKAISQVDLFITTDTGCMHIADTLGVPTLALFGPTLCSKNAPVSNTSRVVRARVACAPCQYTVRFGTCSSWACMEAITVGDVMAEGRKMLNTQRREVA